jgi:hypothetical protein
VRQLVLRVRYCFQKNEFSRYFLNQVNNTYGFESNKLSPPRLRLPNCIPTFSMPDPNELGITTGWSIVLYLALLRCAMAAREVSFGEGVTADP